MIIKRLYTEPHAIDPVYFHAGVNLIVGEADETSSKNNGVGKSLCVEFINFSLLKDKGHSRVSNIPVGAFDPSIFICLDFEVNGNDVTIKRSIEQADYPTVIVNGVGQVFSRLSDATRFLTGILFPIGTFGAITFREMLGPLIRDERSEFKSIMRPFDTDRRVPEDYAPHLMLFGVDDRPYRKIRQVNKEIDDLGTVKRRIEESVTLLRQKTFKDARADLNALGGEVEKIQQGIEALENSPAYDVVKDEILQIEDETAFLRTQKEVLAKRSASLAPLAAEPSIDSTEVGAFFESLRKGLGAQIVRDLEEVMSFKAKIERFQRDVLNQKSKVVDAEIQKISKSLVALDRRYSRLVNTLDQQGKLKSLRQTYAAYQAKSDEFMQLKAFFERHDEVRLDRETKYAEIAAERMSLQGGVSAAIECIRSFERTILALHEFIQRSKMASFDIQVTRAKQAVEFDFRVENDGSHSVDRAKVFMYDLALMLNQFTRHRHPGLLVHDNIFDVDNDTLQRSLEYVLTMADFADDQQYILTLNLDKVEGFTDEAWYDELQGNVVATFTKGKRFLKCHYQER